MESLQRSEADMTQEDGHLARPIWVFDLHLYEGQYQYWGGP